MLSGTGGFLGWIQNELEEARQPESDGPTIALSHIVVHRKFITAVAVPI